MKVEIDSNSGFCFGVVYAIEMAEDYLNESGPLFCLGDIVHNDKEVQRLEAKGLKIIDHEDLKELKDTTVLIRAHGEPPETYKIALQNNIELIDASCPVVLKLQNRVRNAYEEDVQIVIYGKPGHAEVNGLIGQTHQEAIIVTKEEDIEKIDFSRPISLFSQTTKSTEGFYKIKSLIEARSQEFKANDTICRQVSNRDPQLRIFSTQYDVVIFVSGKKSSNGKVLYEVCKSINPRSYFISDVKEIEPFWFDNCESVGICGATSTPMWLMEQVSESIRNLTKEKAV
jgi:4-hydroxy-3-methylbut-2-enyl diphosphate reductase